MNKLILFSALLFAHLSWAAERFYELNIDTLPVNFSGKSTEAMAINGSIPGPKLTFEVGDTAVIKVNNHLPGDASIHWHGLLLPQDQDGVPYITYLPIKSGESFTYRFPITHEGTYWYHSHTNIDEQRGQYGSIVIHPENYTDETYEYDEVVLLSDWTDEDPAQVLKNLKKSGEWYAYKKNSVVSLKGYLDRDRFYAWLTNRWQRMEGMDVSDVGYDAFLANGKKHLQLLPQAKAGERIRLRFINAAASSYFNIEQSETPMTVIAADGVDVQPVVVESFRMGMAETYDVIVTVPSGGGLDLHANNIDGTGYAKISIGSGASVSAPLPKQPDLYQSMDHGGHTGISHNSDHEAHHHMHSHTEHNQRPAELLSYDMLKTKKPVSYDGPLREVVLNLTGDMENYNWSFNNRILSNADKIKIKRGEVVRFVFNNTTMMRHPLHLHGHFFKVLSGNGEHDVLKHTVDVGPMETVTIEFAADAEKDWLFHCHNLYHAKTGMGRVVRYSDYSGNPAFKKAMKSSSGIKDTDWYQCTDLKLFDDYAELGFRYSNYRYAIEVEGERTHWQETEAELAFLRRLSRWSQAYVSVDYEREENEKTYHLGLRYHAPFNIEVDGRLNSDREVHLAVETHFQLTTHWQLDLEADTEGMYSSYVSWRNSPSFSVAVGKTDETSWMLGATVTF